MARTARHLCSRRLIPDVESRSADCRREASARGASRSELGPQRSVARAGAAVGRGAPRSCLTGSSCGEGLTRAGGLQTRSAVWQLAQQHRADLGAGDGRKHREPQGLRFRLPVARQRPVAPRGPLSLRKSAMVFKSGASRFFGADRPCKKLCKSPPVTRGRARRISSLRWRKECPRCAGRRR